MKDFRKNVRLQFVERFRDERLSGNNLDKLKFCRTF